jgi:malate dehydrogenase (oxaloacetate-decarboxylating)(NADP+)
MSHLHRPDPTLAILLGMKMPVHVLQRGIDAGDIVNLAAIAVVDAQERPAAP